MGNGGRKHHTSIGLYSMLFNLTWFFGPNQRQGNLTKFTNSSRQGINQITSEKNWEVELNNMYTQHGLIVLTNVHHTSMPTLSIYMCCPRVGGQSVIPGYSLVYKITITALFTLNAIHILISNMDIYNINWEVYNCYNFPVVTARRKVRHTGGRAHTNFW